MHALFCQNVLIKYTCHVELTSKIPLPHHVHDSYQNPSFPLAKRNIFTLYIVIVRLTMKSAALLPVIGLRIGCYKGNPEQKPQDFLHLDDFIKSKRKIIFCLHKAESIVIKFYNVSCPGLSFLYEHLCL